MNYVDWRKIIASTKYLAQHSFFQGPNTQCDFLVPPPRSVGHLPWILRIPPSFCLGRSPWISEMDRIYPPCIAELFIFQEKQIWSQYKFRIHHPSATTHSFHHGISRKQNIALYCIHSDQCYISIQYLHSTPSFIFTGRHYLNGRLKRY